VQEGSLFSTAPPALVICGFINDGHSDWCEVISHGSFDLHFLQSYFQFLKIVTFLLALKIHFHISVFLFTIFFLRDLPESHQHEVPHCKNSTYKFFFLILWLHLGHMEIPKPRTESDAAATPNPLPHCTWARDWTCTSSAIQATAFGFLSHCATAGTSKNLLSFCSHLHCHYNIKVT